MLFALNAAHGTQALIDALARAVAFKRFRAADVRSILAAGTSAPTTAPAGGALVVDLPVAPTRSLTAYSLAAITGTTTADQNPDTATGVNPCPPTSSTTPAGPVTVPELSADLTAGLRRLKLAAVRRIASGGAARPGTLSARYSTTTGSSGPLSVEWIGPPQQPNQSRNMLTSNVPPVASACMDTCGIAVNGSSRTGPANSGR